MKIHVFFWFQKRGVCKLVENLQWFDIDSWHEMASLRQKLSTEDLFCRIDRCHDSCHANFFHLRGGRLFQSGLKYVERIAFFINLSKVVTLSPFLVDETMPYIYQVIILLFEVKVHYRQIHWVTKKFDNINMGIHIFLWVKFATSLFIILARQ